MSVMDNKNQVKSQIHTTLIEHSRIVYSILSDMAVFYTEWSQDFEVNKEKLDRKKVKMQFEEEEAEIIQKQFIQDFSEAGAQDLGIEGYITFILNMENVINTALEFTTILSFINSKLGEEIKKKYYKLMENVLKMASLLKDTIRDLRDKPEHVFFNITAIHELRNSIDLLLRSFLNFLYNDEDLAIRKLLKIRDSIIILEKLIYQILDLVNLIGILRYQ